MVQITTYPGTMPVAFARKARLRAIAFLRGAVGILGRRGLQELLQLAGGALLRHLEEERVLVPHVPHERLDIGVG